MASREAQARYETASKPSADTRKPLTGARSAYELLKDMETLDREHFVVLHLDIRNRVIKRETLAIGCLSGVDVHPREVFKSAILASAASLIIAHNHPSGDPEPSAQDWELTKRLQAAGKLLGITVLDHIVIGRDSFIGMADKFNWTTM